MKNIINYYYNLNISYLRYINNDYYFNINNKIYIFYCVDNMNINYELFGQIKGNINLHTIIQNRNNEIITTDGKNKYILLKVNIKNNRQINITDILNFNIYYLQNKKTLIYNWNDMWIRKIDYLEYYIESKENITDDIKSCFYYFIGLGENAIKFYTNINNQFNKQTISHRRISLNNTLYDLYNPLNLIIDYKERDISEYLKSLFLNNKYNEKAINDIFNKINPSVYNYELIYCRLLFPTFFFDILDKTVLTDFNEKEILNVYNKSLEYEKYLNMLYVAMNKKVQIPRILWIKKMD